MNTTHSIFNDKQLNCLILGGLHTPKNAAVKASVILLNSGNSHMRMQNLLNLEGMGFEKIISVENDSKNYNIEDFAQKFPSVKFIIPLEKAADGDLINLAAAEISSKSFLILRDSLNVSGALLTPILAQKLSSENIFCVVPRIFTKAGQGIPNQFIPGAKKSVLRIDSSTQVTDGMPTLYPFNFLGLYDTQKFKELGGYDGEIKNSYWQNLDLSFRAWLWGEKIKVSTSFTVTYAEEIPDQDSTPDLSQLRFFLKNMAPVYKNERAEIPASKFWGYKLRSSCGLFESLRQFNLARSWVRKNRCRFKMDAYKLISEWGSF
ncbi:MAG: hypothetical protein K6A42_04925 [Treponema sp.]|nr:hypothetical protein [Treponema sp.]